ncbi:hypothetical protein [Gallaecimonas pentaromativorans]|uniref:Uncharacterized protein n=1 Tax=Gallaecimonas pentaromativorans TaxID=584787 RepID=A0A3N1P8X9_9GAMM|nr:hypothetical protein [Gallaecimonas pentaromativorans]MED5525766.1 hypothetical protein [Pseudomonadota bacterium]ROQ25003.1 hypothetical protein EDC28_106253 [Gallaecimonas pentaromativorans]
MELQELTDQLVARYQEGLEMWQYNHETEAGQFTGSFLVHRDWETLTTTEPGSWLACLIYCLEVAAVVRLANELPGLGTLPDAKQLELAALISEAEMSAALLRALPQGFGDDHPKGDEEREFIPDEAHEMLDILVRLADSAPEEHQHDGDSFICLMDTLQSGAVDFAAQYVAEDSNMMQPSLGASAILQDMLVEMTVLDQDYVAQRLLTFIQRFCNPLLTAQRLEMLTEMMGKPTKAPMGRLH